MTRVAVYPGTFDPVTLGHLDIIARAARLVDRLVVGVTTNPSKAPLFPVEERLAIVAREAAAVAPNVTVVEFGGLLVDFARNQGAGAIVRGLRSGTDFDYEYQMAQLNRGLADEVETLCLMAAAALQPISSSFVREIARLGGDITPLVSPGVAADVRAKIAHG